MKLYFLVILSISLCIKVVSGFTILTQDEEQIKLSIRSKYVEAMKSYMNSSINPCDNFYEYACGQWNDNNPKDNFFTVFALLERDINLMVQTMLSSPADGGNKLEKQAKTFFASCRNDDKINDKSLESVKFFINYLGGWPDMDEKWSENHFNLINTLVKRTKTGQKSIITLDIGPDITDSKIHNIYIMEPATGLQDPDDYLKQDENHSKNLKAYRMLILDILRIFSIPMNSDKMDQIANDIINFETSLTDFKSPRHLTHIEKNNPTTLQSLINDYPDFDWKKYFDGVFGREVPLNQNAIIYGIQSFDKLIHLITTTETKILSNYMAWQTIFHLSTEYLLDDNFVEAITKFNQVILGESVPSRRSLCAYKTKTLLDLIVSSMFIKNINFDPTAHEDVEEMTKNIKDEFGNRLEMADWIDSETKADANLKLSNTDLAIGQPDILNDEQDLMDYYEELDIFEEDKYLQNYVQLARFTFKKESSKFYQPVDKSQWPDSALSINAFFLNNQNRIVIPGGVLQPPIYHKYFPKALKYGKLGFFVGHELTHGFDIKGKEYDYQGEVKSWWSPESESNFNQKATCIVDQYNSYSLFGQQVSGSHTLSENIADNGAIRLAYMSYKKWLETASDNDILEEELSDMDINDEKLFFLGMAQALCTSPISPEAAANHLLEEHSPAKFRVMGMLQNLPEFSDVYDCPAGSVMNPEEKCSIW